MNINKLIDELTIEEKAALLSGTDFMYTNAVPRLNIPALAMADGPHGLRKQIGTGDNGVGESEPATAFPTAATIASSWNVENAGKMAQAIGDECRHYGVNILLGPGINIKKNPTCGRNFEYYSEDPCLSAAFGSEFVRELQKRNVGASLKHFAANNTENFRFMGDSIVDERALREIYLRSFEKVVKESKPYTMMCAYNRINGTFCSENRWLLSEVLRDEWGFEGAVMTDWGATKDRVMGVKAGLELEMPGDTVHCRHSIIAACKSGALKMEDVDLAVKNVLNLVQRCSMQEKSESFPKEEHHKLAGDIAKDCAVLLKNDGVLPLQKECRLLFVGDLYRKMRYQGSGSSMIQPTMLTTPTEAFKKRGLRYSFVPGYEESKAETNPELFNQALAEAYNADTIIFYGGLTDLLESEGGDRENMELPQNQLELIARLAKTGKPVVVVLFGGSPVEVPFHESVSAILNMYLPGQNGGEAVAALLLGETNPSGKLAETWPLRYLDVPFGATYGKEEREIYKESIYVGYRYYCSAEKKVRYPFGYGLSYTEFQYDNLKVEKNGDRISVSVDIRNIGACYGGEIVQLYVQNPKGINLRAKRELRDFTKVYLRPNECKTVKMSFAKADLSYYHTKKGAWVMESGEYTVEIGASCEDIRLKEDIFVEGDDGIIPAMCDAEVLAAYNNIHELAITDTIFMKLSGQDLGTARPVLPLTIESRIADFRHTFFGNIFYKILLGVPAKQLKAANKMEDVTEKDNMKKGAIFLIRILSTNSLRSLSMSAAKTLPYNLAQGLVCIANGKLIMGLKHILNKIEVPPLPKESQEAN